MKMNLDLSQVGTFGMRTTVPGGKYNVKVVEAKPKPCANGDMLVMKYQLTDGEFKGATIVDRIIFNNPKPDVVRMALSKIKAIKVHSGSKNPDKLGDSDELVGLGFSVIVTLEEDTWEGKTFKKNNVQGYDKISTLTEAPKEIKKEEVKAESSSKAMPWE